MRTFHLSVSTRPTRHTLSVDGLCPASTLRHNFHVRLLPRPLFFSPPLLVTSSSSNRPCFVHLVLDPQFVLSAKSLNEFVFILLPSLQFQVSCLCSVYSTRPPEDPPTVTCCPSAHDGTVFERRASTSQPWSSSASTSQARVR